MQQKVPSRIGAAVYLLAGDMSTWKRQMVISIGFVIWQFVGTGSLRAGFTTVYLFVAPLATFNHTSYPETKIKPAKGNIRSRFATMYLAVPSPVENSIEKLELGLASQTDNRFDMVP